MTLGNIFISLLVWASFATVYPTRVIPEVGEHDILLDSRDQITEHWSITNNCVYANNVAEYSDFCPVPADTEAENAGYWSPCNIPSKNCLFTYTIPKSNSSQVNSEEIINGIQIRTFLYEYVGYTSTVRISYKNPEDTQFTTTTISGSNEWRLINSPMISLKEEAIIEIQLNIVANDANSALDYILLKGAVPEK